MGPIQITSNLSAKELKLLTFLNEEGRQPTKGKLERNKTNYLCHLLVKSYMSFICTCISFLLRTSDLKSVHTPILRCKD